MSTTADFEDVNEDGGIDGLEPNFTEVDGLETRYYEYGDGVPLVLIHGGSWNPYTSANVWSRNIRELSEHFHVFAPDRVGSGLTDIPDDPDDFVYETELNHMLGFLDKMGIDEFNVVGSSRGAGLAGRIAVEIPDRVLSLVAVNTSTLSPEVGDYYHRFDALSRGGPDTDFVDQARYMMEINSYSNEHLTDEYVKTAAYFRSLPKSEENLRIMEETTPDDEEYISYKGGGQWHDSLEQHIWDTHRAIKEGVLTMPTLLWYGRNDLTLPLLAPIYLYDMIGQKNDDVRMKIVNRAGHLPYREHPDEFNLDVKTFINFWTGSDS